jgi:hypothetical protein
MWPTRLSFGTLTLSKNVDVGDRANGDAGRVHRHQQEADAVLLLRLLVGAYQEKDPVGVHRQRGPDLLAVDHPMVALQHRLGAQRGEVGAGVGLAVALAPDVLARQDLRQEILLLLRAAEFDQQRADHGHAHVVQPGAAVALLFFQEDQLLGRGDPHAAELLRPVRREPALLSQLHVPGLVVLEVQPRRRIADLRRIIGLDPLAHMDTELIVGEGVEVLGGGAHGVGSLDVGLGGVAATEARVEVWGQSAWRAGGCCICFRLGMVQNRYGPLLGTELK